jgi:transposase
MCTRKRQLGWDLTRPPNVGSWDGPIRGQLAEFGIVLAKGIHHVLNLVGRLLDGETLGIPPLARKVVLALAEQLRDLQARIRDLETDLVRWSRDDPVAKRLQSIPGIGVITASALVTAKRSTSSPQ